MFRRKGVTTFADSRKWCSCCSSVSGQEQAYLLEYDLHSIGDDTIRSLAAAGDRTAANARGLGKAMLSLRNGAARQCLHTDVPAFLGQMSQRMLVFVFQGRKEMSITPSTVCAHALKHCHFQTLRLLHTHKLSHTHTYTYILVHAHSLMNVHTSHLWNNRSPRGIRESQSSDHIMSQNRIAITVT